MRTFPRLLVALLLSVLGLVLAAGPVQAYPDPGDPTMEIDPHACAGDPVPYFAQATVSGDWVVTYKDIVVKGSGTRIEGTFPSTKADAGVRHTFTATITTDEGDTLTRSTAVVLTRCGSGPGTGTALPSTGSDIPLWTAVLGLALLSLGSSVVLRRRVR